MERTYNKIIIYKVPKGKHINYVHGITRMVLKIGYSKMMDKYFKTRPDSFNENDRANSIKIFEMIKNPKLFIFYLRDENFMVSTVAKTLRNKNVQVVESRTDIVISIPKKEK